MMRTGWMCAVLTVLAARLASAAPAMSPSFERPEPEKPVHTARAVALPSLDLEPTSLTHWMAAPGSGAAAGGSATPPDLHGAELRFGAALKVRWETPGLPALARDFHQHGIPILPLWQNSQSLVALGLDRKGVLGLYLRPKSE